jgi:hypothetical protein
MVIPCALAQLAKGLSQKLRTVVRTLPSGSLRCVASRSKMRTRRCEVIEVSTSMWMASRLKSSATKEQPKPAATVQCIAHDIRRPDGVGVLKERTGIPVLAWAGASWPWRCRFKLHGADHAIDAFVIEVMAMPAQQLVALPKSPDSADLRSGLPTTQNKL